MNALPQKENLKKFADIDACPVRHILSRITGKWSVLILCILAENEITRFSEIGRTLPDISPKVLSSTLKNLEADGLIYRNLYAEIPPRVEYSLTPLGSSLLPHLYSLISWARANFDPILRNRRSTT